ncbi:MAG: SMP-30/gluconolactonase/LRE family protein [Betaproteobacteria bacterium]|jgi:gluconolactonase
MTIQFSKVAGPFKGSLGGVTWDGEGVLFSLLDEMEIKKYIPSTKAVSDFRLYSGRINGICYEPSSGIVYAAQESGRRVIELLPDGSACVTALRYRGAIHNHPTDLVVDHASRIWFADPHSAILAFGPQIFPALDHASIMRIEKDERHAFVMHRVTYDTHAPRAVLLSNDEKTLYVADGNPDSPHRELRAYPINPDLSVGRAKVFYTFGADDSGKHRGIEGMCLDTEGRIFAVGGSSESGPGSMLFIFSPNGYLISSHPLPFDKPSRISFGGKDMKQLYITGGDSCLYEAHTEFTGFVRKSSGKH